MSKTYDDLATFDLKNHPNILRLIKLGKKNRELTIEQINKSLPPELNHEDIIDNIFLLLNEEDIEVIDEYHIKVEDENESLNKEEMEGIMEKLMENNRKMDDPIRLYLKDIGKIKLLSKDEERNLAIGIEKGNKTVVDTIHEMDIFYHTIYHKNF